MSHCGMKKITIEKNFLFHATQYPHWNRLSNWSGSKVFFFIILDLYRKWEKILKCSVYHFPKQWIDGMETLERERNEISWCIDNLQDFFFFLKRKGKPMKNINDRREIEERLLFFFNLKECFIVPLQWTCLIFQNKISG